MAVRPDRWLLPLWLPACLRVVVRPLLSPVPLVVRGPEAVLPLQALSSRLWRVHRDGDLSQTTTRILAKTRLGSRDQALQAGQ